MEDAFRWTLPIQNSTDRDISIRSIGGTCTCTKMQPRSLVIPPHEVRVVDLTIDLRARTSADAHRMTRPFEVDIDAQLDATSATFAYAHWKLRGVV